MGPSFTLRRKLIIIIAFFAIAIIGFMIKLPAVFRHVDKELHAAFYFLAAALLNALFSGSKISKHLAIFVALFLFGMTIEYGQAYSNKIFHTRIHGRFDPEDVQWNLKGLLAFSALWLPYMALKFVYKRSTTKDTVRKPAPSNGI